MRMMTLLFYCISFSQKKKNIVPNAVPGHSERAKRAPSDPTLAQKMTQESFNGNRSINPDEVLAVGVSAQLPVQTLLVHSFQFRHRHSIVMTHHIHVGSRP